jgi:hypothetical protein
MSKFTCLVGRSQSSEAVGQHHAKKNEIARQDGWPKVMNATCPFSRRFLFPQLRRNFFHEANRPRPFPDSIEPVNGDTCLSQSRAGQRAYNCAYRVRISAAVQSSLIIPRPKKKRIFHSPCQRRRIRSVDRFFAGSPSASPTAVPSSTPAKRSRKSRLGPVELILGIFFRPCCPAHFHKLME